MLEVVRPFLKEHITGAGSTPVINLVLIAGILVASVVVYYLTKWALRIVEKVVLRSPTDWDDDLLNKRLIKAVSQLAPALAVRWLIPGLFGETASSVRWLSAITSLYILVAAVRIFTIFVDNLYNAFVRREQLKAYAVKGLFEMVKLIIIGIGVIIGLSILINKSPVVIITALGASAAVLMLVFQDTILGLVASVQLTANKMLQRGDWIESKAHDVNGEVLEVSLTSVKVRNWDNTVSTVPPYSLVKGSFRNYQPMRSSGGRRVDRAVYIDINTVGFCTPEQLKALEEKGRLAGLDLDDAAKEVNLNLLRRYLEHYLDTSPRVNHSMTAMVRQLDPTPQGLPLGLYFFTSNVDWKVYEHIQADIFNHVYAVVHEFGIALFQTPAGTDISRLKK